MSLKATQWGALIETSEASETSSWGKAAERADRRIQAQSRLSAPSPQSREAWRYTQLRSLKEKRLHVPTSAQLSDIDASILRSDDRSKQALMTINGSPRRASAAQEQVTEPGLRTVKLSDLRTQPSHDDLEERALAWIEREQARVTPLHDLLSLHQRDAWVVLVPAEHHSEDLPIKHIRAQVSGETSVVSAPNLWVYLAEGAQLSIDERYQTSEQADGVSIGLTGLYISARAHLQHVRAQLEVPTDDPERPSVHLAHVCAQIDGKGHYQLTSLNLGSEVSRIELDVSLNAPDAQAELSGLYVGTGRATLDQHLTLRHHAPRCHSSQRFKGVLGDSSRGIFTGRVVVAEGASQTLAEQHNPNLLLSERARAVTRPQLEIYNDDVECSHGATVGQLDEDALFYLRSRGLDYSSALRILAAAFAGEVRSQVDTETALTMAIDQALSSALGVNTEGSSRSDLWIDWAHVDSSEDQC